MKFDYQVKYNGVIYAKGEEVPMEEVATESPFIDSTDEKSEDTKLTFEYLSELKVAELKDIAQKRGITLTATKKSDIIAEILM